MKSGIYKIQSKIKPDRFYIGSAKDIEKRWNVHINSLRRGCHHSKTLQRHFNKYGEDDLVMSVLVRCELSLLLKMEQLFLDSHDTYFNTCKIAGSPQGTKRSEESKRKTSKKLKGRIFSDETKKKISQAVSGERHRMFGKKHSEETKAKYSKARSGQNNPRYGKPVSAETRRKISEANKGRTVSKEVIAKWRNRIVSDETRAKLSKAGKGRKRSPETRERMRRAQAIRWGFEYVPA